MAARPAASDAACTVIVHGTPISRRVSLTRSVAGGVSPRFAGAGAGATVAAPQPASAATSRPAAAAAA
ncbi:MAG: hypothetical protein ACKOHK_04255 [Planctomycetia bacterium]